MGILPMVYIIHGQDACAMSDPTPVLQPSPSRIGKHIINLVIKIDFVTNEVIVVLFLPDLSRSSKSFVHCFSGEGFPRVQDIFQRISSCRSQDDVDMIRHHTPRMYVISATFKEADCVCNEFCDSILFHPTKSVIRVWRKRVPLPRTILPGQKNLYWNDVDHRSCCLITVCGGLHYNSVRSGIAVGAGK